MMQFTFVGVPFRDDVDLQLQNQLGKLQSSLGSLGPGLRNIMIPQLRVGTLDALVEASDELSRLDPQLENTVFRLCSLVEDIADVPRATASMISVQSQQQRITTEYYLKEFDAYGWNVAQYDTKDGVHGLIQKFQQVLTSSEERCRGLLNEYNEARNKLQTIQRRTQGNLNSIPINEVVDKWCRKNGLPNHQPTDTEFLTTLFVAVPVAEQDQWLENYAGFHDFVVPRSSEPVAVDSEYVLFSVVCFKKVVDDVKNKCRQMRFSVRELATSEDVTPEAIIELKETVAHARERLSNVLSQQYTQCFTAWVHLKVVRLFVEGILKYGHPKHGATSSFLPVLIVAEQTREEEMLSAMNKLFEGGKYESPLMAAFGAHGGGGDDGAMHNAKLAQFMGDNSVLQTDGCFVVLKMSNVLKGR